MWEIIAIPKKKDNLNKDIGTMDGNRDTTEEIGVKILMGMGKFWG